MTKAAEITQLLQRSRTDPSVHHLRATCRACGGSELVRLSAKQRAEKQHEMERIQTACFGRNGSELPEEELRRVAKKWLRIAC